MLGWRLFGNDTIERRSSTFCRFRSLFDPSSKISIRLDSPNSDVERNATSSGNPFMDLDGNRDLLLDFFGGAPGPLCDDLDVVVRHIRISFHRKRFERNGAPDKHQQSCREHHKAIAKREIYKALKHPRKRTRFPFSKLKSA